MKLEMMVVDSRAAFTSFLGLLRQELIANPERWENISLPSFLEAMESYSADIDGFYQNTDQTIDADVPSWQIFANILLGARMYE